MNINTVSSDWSKYYELTKDNPPSNLLVRALEHIPHVGNAIDIGCGGLRDSKFLLEKGFTVTALDQDPSVIVKAQSISSSRFKFVISSFDNFDFPEESFDLALAILSLPFNPPGTFNKVLKKILKSIKPGGIFCGQLFGLNDSWNAEGREMTFLSKENALKPFIDFEKIYFEEKEKAGTTAAGVQKHWHVFNVIAKKL
jgi:SAM-dependent methyltransferase